MLLRLVDININASLIDMNLNRSLYSRRDH